MATTGNWKRTVVEQYLQQTLYRADDIFAQGQGVEGGPGEPLKWKLYCGVERVPLTEQLPDALGDLRRSLSGDQPARSTNLSEEDLSALLYLTYGFARWEPGPGAGWPLHRTVASARCLFPTELYVGVPSGLPTVQAGLYHYDPAHHLLALLRPGDPRDRLGEVVGADLADACCVLMVSSLFWKTAFKYRNYAYRLCTQEAGMVLGNALAVTGTLGLDHHVHYQFVDWAANRLLGLDPGQESVLAVVAVYPPSARPDGIRRSPGPVGEGGLLPAIPEIRPAHVDLGRLNEDLCGMVTRIDQSSYLHSADEFTSQEPVGSTCGDGPGNVVSIPADDSEPLDLVAALRARNSGRVLFTPLRQPITVSALLDVVRYCSGRHPSDLRPTSDPPRPAVHLAVNNVDRQPPGVYRWCPTHRGLHAVALGDPTEQLQDTLKVPNVDLRAANLVAFVVADHRAAIETFGNRAYRILNMESGVLAKRICLLSAAHGLSARVHNGYDAVRAKKLLHLTEPESTPFFQIIVGRDSLGVRYGLPIKF